MYHVHGDTMVMGRCITPAELLSLCNCPWWLCSLQITNKQEGKERFVSGVLSSTISAPSFKWIIVQEQQAEAFPRCFGHSPIPVVMDAEPQNKYAKNLLGMPQSSYVFIVHSPYRVMSSLKTLQRSLQLNLRLWSWNTTARCQMAFQKRRIYSGFTAEMGDGDFSKSFFWGWN